MRPIKFRAWDKVEKKWLFGYEYPNLGGFSLLGETVLMGELGSLPLQKLLEDVEIMQFTGFGDRAGKEIYEYDIVRFADKYNYIVKWDDGRWVCDHVVERWGRWGNLHRAFEWDFTKHEFKVIGNIYENENLIEEINKLNQEK